MTKQVPAKKATEKKLKLGQAVRATAAGGAVTEGRYAGTVDVTRKDGKPGGVMVRVNIAPKGKPAEYKSYRPKAVVAI